MNKALPLILTLLFLTSCASDRTSMRPRAESIRWERVAELLKSGQVRSVFQSHNLTVFISTLDGRHFITSEPSIDKIVSAVEEYAPNSRNIAIMTE